MRLRPLTRAARQIRSITLHVDATPDGSYVFRGPRGWRRRVTTTTEMSAVLVEAFVEWQIEAYARAHGSEYDLSQDEPVNPDDPTTAPAPTIRRKVKNSRVSAQWEEMPDGTWRSPKGRFYDPDSQAVRQVRAARDRATQPDP